MLTVTALYPTVTNSGWMDCKVRCIGTIAPIVKPVPTSLQCVTIVTVRRYEPSCTPPDTGLAMRTNVTHVRTLPKRYPDLNHTHKHTCGLSAVWCGVVWCEVSVIVVWCGVVWCGLAWCGVVTNRFF
jgi:hypothetical protein